MFGKRQYMKFRGEMEKKKAKKWENWGQMRFYEKYGYFKIYGEISNIKKDMGNIENKNFGIFCNLAKYGKVKKAKRKWKNI